MRLILLLLLFCVPCSDAAAEPHSAQQMTQEAMMKLPRVSTSTCRWHRQDQVVGSDVVKGDVVYFCKIDGKEIKVKKTCDPTWKACAVLTSINTPKKNPPTRWFNVHLFVDQSSP